MAIKGWSGTPASASSRQRRRGVAYPRTILCETNTLCVTNANNESETLIWLGESSHRSRLREGTRQITLLRFMRRARYPAAEPLRVASVLPHGVAVTPPTITAAGSRLTAAAPRTTRSVCEKSNHCSTRTGPFRWVLRVHEMIRDHIALVWILKRPRESALVSRNEARLQSRFTVARFVWDGNRFRQ